MARDLRDALNDLDRTSRRIGQVEYYVYRDPPRGGRSYLCGIPYLWSGFRERAFAFASAEQAQALIDEFPLELRGAQVGQTPLSDPASS